MSIDQYFKHIAVLAGDAVAQAQRGQTTPKVIDGPQEPRATAWASRSVHPLQFLETTYMAEVQQAVELAGNDTDQARENEFAAMSKYFSLSATEPDLLLPASEPLIAARCKALKAQMLQIQAMLAGNSVDTYDSLVDVVDNALETLSRMTTAASKQYAAQDVQDALAYCGLFPNDPAQAFAAWKSNNPQNAASLKSLVDTVETRLVRPVVSNATAAASPFSLYNIEAFYLFRLMHRFIGGDRDVPMDITQKGIASGAATGAMHLPTTKWLSDWHEEQIQALDSAVQQLSATLKHDFNLATDPLRFYLKGGRAMNFCLGTPAAGTNDWDTGILIDPGLPPIQWYHSFAAVNDLVVHFLDRARFGYTELLNKNEASLLTKLVNAPRIAVDHDDLPEFTRSALQVEHLAERMASLTQRATLGGVRSMVGAAQPHRTTGVNGELIDIGVSTRSSVELAEHWGHLKILRKPGVTGAMIPVPDLAYFVDDFTTMIREAIATDTVGRKLAKRLSRLNQVLESNDAEFVQAVAERYSTVKTRLPLTLNARKSDTTTAKGRLEIWLLSALVDSVPPHLISEPWMDALDRYIVANAAGLFSNAAVATFWTKLSTEFDTQTKANQAQDLLVVENAISALSNVVLADARCLAAAIGNPVQSTALWPVVKVVLDAIFVSLQPPYLFKVTSRLAAQMLAQNPQVPDDNLRKAATCGAAEVCCLANNRAQLDGYLNNLANRLGNLSLLPITVSYDQASGVVRVMTNQAIAGMKIVPANSTLIVIRAATPIEQQDRSDAMNGWPITSARSLVRQITADAGNTPDYDMRAAKKAAEQFVLKSVLGRQIN